MSSLKRKIGSTKSTHSRIFLLSAVMLVIVSLAGCGIAGVGRETTDMEIMPAETFMKAAPQSLGFASMAYEGAGLVSDSRPTQASSRVEVGRKKIQSADLEIEVKNLADTETAIRDRVNRLNGWIDQAYFYETRISFTVRIPVEEFDRFILEVGDIGVMKEKSISTEDVTDYYMDTTLRLASLRELYTRLSSYLQESGTLEEIMTVEREINDLMYEIENYERTLRSLDGQVNYATIYIGAQLPREEQVSVDLPSIQEGLKRLGYGAVSLMYYILMGLLYAVVFGIPSILALGLLYLLGWGRIGLVRKFFRVLSGRRSETRKRGAEDVK